MQGVFVVKSPAGRSAAWARRVAVSGALGVALLGVCCVALMSASQPGSESVLQAAPLDPDAPHARSSTSQMYMTRFDPDSPHVAVKGRGPGKGLKLEYNMQNVLAHMSKGMKTSSSQKVQVQAPRLYNPSADPDAPSTNDHEQLSPLTQNMQARLSAETKMDQELQLKASVAELSPKFMPTSEQDSMMLNLKSSKPTHITFTSDAASKDDSKISKQVAAANTQNEAKKEVQALAREKEKAARLRKRRREEASWIKHNWAVNGPPKKPGFRYLDPCYLWWG